MTPQTLPTASQTTAAATAVLLPLDPRTFDRALACVHCGLCLPACPTYAQTGHEADSPRGRIQLMRALAEDRIELSASVRRHLDLCLDCRGCETACPSGVIYHELIEETRYRLADAATAPLSARLLGWFTSKVMVYPSRLKLALLPARLMQRAGLYGLFRRGGAMRLLPEWLRKMEQMLPESGTIWPRPPRRITRPASGSPRARVAFLAGCVGSVLYEQVNRQAIELLAAAGAQVIVPGSQVCCGAIHHHNGDWSEAQSLARRNIDVFMPDGSPPPDLIVSTIAGCGAMLREYGHLLRDDARYAARAADFAARVRDISEALLELGPPPMPYPVRRIATYHDACHLIHAQKVADAPRRLLAAVSGLKLVALLESDMCCGAAGTYNLTQPLMAADLARRKLANIVATGADTCLVGNVGCALHIGGQARADGLRLDVLHPVQVIHQAVFGDGER
jgi:glycolate oxidase iron-sulfur subunit